MRWRPAPSQGQIDSPIVIGGTGGSGTRAVREAFVRAGVFMGTRVNSTGDALDFVPFLDAQINPILEQTRSLDYSDGQTGRARMQELRKLVQGYFADVPDAAVAWGWKNPRSMYILPLINGVCPGFRFVHMLRDGRDMALSNNQNQVRQHYEVLFGRPLGDELPIAAMQLWRKANTDVSEWGRRELGDRYIAVRYEALCVEPIPVLKGLFDALQLAIPPEAIKWAAEVFQDNPGMGRWRRADPKLIEQLDRIGRAGLEGFGYQR